MKKRVLSLLLALCLVLGALPLSALATAATDVPPASVTDIADPAPAAPEEEKEPIVEEPPIDEDPAEEEGPVEEEAPADEEPDEEEAPAEEEPVEENPAKEDAPIEENPAKEDAPIEENPAKEDAPIEEEPADEEAGIAPLAETKEASCLAVYEDAPTTATTKAGALYQLDLDNIFCDTSNHALTYSLESTVSNDKTKIKDGVFYFSVPDTDDYTVTLKATCADGKSLSHQLTITVEAAAEGIATQYGYDETAANSVTVYVTVSNDGMPLVGQDETVLSHLKVTVPYFDLGLYGLEDYYRYGTENGKGSYVGDSIIHRPTGLHLYIYLLERYYMGLPESQCGKGSSSVLDYSGEAIVRYMDGAEAYESDGKQALQISGSATSLYMVNFWGHDENLMYFRNHCYPLMSAGWGSTSDYILLSDGDTWDVAMFTNWSFYHSGWFARFDKDAYTVEAGKDLTLSTLKWGTTSEAVDFETISGLTVGLYDSNWTFVKEVAYTSGNSLSFTAPEKAGEYYLLAMDPNATNGTLAKGAPATAQVTVTAAASVPVTGVTLDQTEVLLAPETTVKLEATVTPEDATDKTVTWTSDKEAVATVAEDGTVTAVAKGTATITATIGEFTATCTVTVNSKPTLIEGVTDVVAKVQTKHAYQLKDLENGKIFEDADGDKLTYASYFYKKSSDGGETWGELTGFTASLFGGNDMTFANDKEGTYIYKFWAYDGYEYSEDTWTLTLVVMDVVPADINFYVGYDQNYVKANYEAGTYKYPVLELYRTAGIDDDFNDYIGWFTNAEDETVYVYHPQEYAIAVDGEKAYVELGESRYELHDYEKLTFTNSSFLDGAEDATPSNTVVGSYNMFYVSLETGRYSTRFYGYNSNTGSYDVYLGGQSMALPMELDIYGGGGNDLYFRVVSIYTNSKMLDGNYFTAEDYDAEISMPITGSNIQHGYPYVKSGQTYYPFMSWANGNGSVYAAYVYPNDTENYVFNQAINQTTVAGASVVTKNMTIGTALALSVTVPEDSDFGLYFQYNNFNTSVVAPRSEAVSNGDGTKTLVYNVSKGSGNYTWRLTDPTGAHVTKGGWLKSITAATEMTFTFSEQTNSKSHSFSNLGTTVATRDEADIQLFASHSGFLSISGTKRIRAYRMWELINSDTANIMVEPDYNVQFLQGNSSDLKQVDGGNGGGNWLDVTPTGTDIIAVSYDAIDMYAETGTHNTHGGFFPATNPERTAVMVVTNGSSGSADATIAFNGSKETSRGDEWDYNYDTWFYMDTDEAPTLDFTVSGNGLSSVSYAYVTTNSSLVSTLSGWTTITADEDGYYHTDLLAFRDAGTLGGTVIIKMVDATGTSYRLVRVAQMSVTIANVSFPGEAPTAGDQVKLTFDGLYRSVNKIAGVFNPTVYYLRYTQDGTEVNGQLGQYQQMDRASITLTIPEDVEVDEDGKASYTFTNGYVYGQMYSAVSPFDTMYEMSDTGMGTNFSAASINMVLSRLADVTVEVGTKTSYDITLDVTEGASPLTGYTFTLVSPDGETLTADESGIYKNLSWGVYSYTLSKSGYLCVTGTQTIGESYTDLKDDNGLVHWAFTLEKGAEGCWDGTKSEPAQIDGVYQIGTGAELAWFADYVNAGNASVSAVLTADIDLAKFPWTPIGSKSNVFSGSFDGQNHTISNLLLSYSSTTSTSPYLGLFGYVQGASATNMASIANLTVSGNVTATSTANVSQANSAAVIGYAKYATVSKIHNKADVTLTRVNGTWNYAGGVLGNAENCTIIGCTNSGSLYGYNYMAGIAGYIKNVTMEDCANYGTVQANSYAAGITGASYGSTTITRCVNKGSISTYGSGNAAGIAGQSTGTTVISLCYNQGTIQCAGGYAGGIAGNNRGTITACYNLADVTSQTYAGGIAGYSNNVSITNTYNTGKVSATGDYVGAIAGYGTTNTKTTIDRNYYLEGTWSVGIGYTGTNRNNTVDPVAISQSDLTSKAFATLLNEELEEDAFGLGSGHPLLLWQDGAVAIVPGDLNGDGNVDMDDVAVLLQVVNGTAEAQEGLDLNEDGNTDMKDIVILLQIINAASEA